jgi:heptosyltransferase III
MLARNILIFHAGALGDFVQTWPLGLALGRLYPQSRVIFVTQRQKGLLAEKVLRLEFTDVESGWHHLFGDALKLPDFCRAKLASSHAVFTFIAKPGDTWCASVASIAPKAQIVPVAAGAMPQMLESLASLPAISTAVAQLLASIAQRGVQNFTGRPDGPVAIHPGAGSPEKCWPIDHYLELIHRLHDAGHHCRIILGEVELERWRGDEIRRLHSADEVVQPATYLDLYRELCDCCAFVGNDSGPGQLAGIVGLPSVILFGPTDPALWKPLGPRVLVLRAQPLTSLSTQSVFEAVGALLPRALSPAQAD